LLITNLFLKPACEDVGVVFPPPLCLHRYDMGGPVHFIHTNNHKTELFAYLMIYMFVGLLINSLCLDGSEDLDPNLVVSVIVYFGRWLSAFL